MGEGWCSFERGWGNDGASAPVREDWSVVTLRQLLLILSQDPRHLAKHLLHVEHGERLRRNVVGPCRDYPSLLSTAKLLSPRRSDPEISPGRYDSGPATY
jgi:hypothetical protein